MKGMCVAGISEVGGLESAKERPSSVMQRSQHDYHEFCACAAFRLGMVMLSELKRQGQGRRSITDTARQFALRMLRLGLDWERAEERKGQTGRQKYR